MLTHLALRLLIAFRGALDRAREDDGQTLAEYSLIVTTIAVGVVVLSVVVFRNTLADTWNSVSDCLNQVSPCS